MSNEIQTAEFKAASEKAEIVSKSYVIKTQDDAIAANQELGELSRLYKKQKEKLDYMLEPAKEQIRRINEEVKPYLDRIDEARRSLKASIDTFLAEDRVRAEEARQTAIKAQQEIVRMAEESALKAMESGSEDAALAAMQMAETMSQMTVCEPTTTKLDGYSQRVTWKARLIDKKLLIDAALKGNMLAMSMIEFNQSTANAHAKALKSEFSVPGIEVYKETTGVKRSK